MLSRQQMVDVIKGGGSVLHNGRLITKEENLPSAASLAQTPEEKAVAAEDIDAQIEKLQAQRDALADKEAADKAEADKVAKQAEAQAKKDAEAKAKADKEAADKAKSGGN